MLYLRRPSEHTALDHILIHSVSSETSPSIENETALCNLNVLWRKGTHTCEARLASWPPLFARPHLGRAAWPCPVIVVVKEPVWTRTGPAA